MLTSFSGGESLLKLAQLVVLPPVLERQLVDALPVLAHRPESADGPSDTARGTAHTLQTVPVTALRGHTDGQTHSTHCTRHPGVAQQRSALTDRLQRHSNTGIVDKVPLRAVMSSMWVVLYTTQLLPTHWKKCFMVFPDALQEMFHLRSDVAQRMTRATTMGATIIEPPNFALDTYTRRLFSYRAAISWNVQC